MSAEAQAYRGALVRTAIALGALGVVGAAVAWWWDGPSAAVGAAVGALVAALAALPTQGAMLVGHTRSPSSLAAIVLGAWLAKMFVIVIAMIVLIDLEGFHKVAFATVVMVGIVLSLVFDIMSIRKARVPYVDPGTKS
ncbi:hypothetical protein [Demequina pelophila]|uniref:hypothetical protein n=1 Tax=Demequina pelophila TaxID=1638984 RepID=UPI000785D43A|nr:hypothetical protein [Demequina pelophila]